ncbi:hypothetical protein [Arcticibacter tournemirensis]|nr:hypothetical protein [Arcticibacter tournemirensis]
MKLFKIASIVFLLAFCSAAIAQEIDRKAVVGRHEVTVSCMDTLSSLTL